MNSRFGLKASFLALLVVSLCTSGQAAVTAYNSVVWAAEGTADGTGVGTLNGANTVTYTTTVVLNAGITFDTAAAFPPSWNASPATNGGGTLAYSSTLAGVLGTSGAADVQTITFTSKITNPVLLVDFAAASTVITIPGKLTLLSANNCSLAANTIACPTAVRTASDGFAVRIMGTFGPGNPLFFSYADLRGANTIGFSIASLPPPTIAKTFTPNTIGVGSNSTVTFTIANPNATALTNVAFSDTLPAGLVVAAAANVASTCGGTVTATSGSGVISLANGAVAASASCTIHVDVTAVTGGVKNNTTSAVTSNEADNSNVASATLTVEAAPVITKAFADAVLQLPSGTTALTFTILNPAGNPLPLSSIAFTDTLPAGLIVATPNGLTGSCDGGSIAANAGSNSISLSSATLASGASCTFSVNVTGILPGVQDNVTSNVTAIAGGTTITGNVAKASTEVTNLFFMWFFYESGGGDIKH